MTDDKSELREKIACKLQITYKKADEAISLCTEHSKQSEWVSVEDRLPERGRPYLAYDEAYGVGIYLYGNNGGWLLDDETYCDYVTHWQPFPSPPEPIEDEK